MKFLALPLALSVKLASMREGDWIALLLSIPITLAVGLAVDPIKRWYAAWGKTRKERREMRRENAAREFEQYVLRPEAFTHYLLGAVMKGLFILSLLVIGISFLIIAAWIHAGRELDKILAIGHAVHMTRWERIGDAGLGVMGGVAFEVGVLLAGRHFQEFNRKWAVVKRFRKQVEKDREVRKTKN